MIESKKFSLIIQNVKNKFDDLLLESKIEQEFKNSNTKFSLYTKENIFPIFLYGKIDNNEIIVYGDYNIRKNSVIINECNKKAYYVINISQVEIKTKYNNSIYIRKGTKILLDDNVEEINVIKAGKKYYIYKE